jgi:hypothetical protein
MMMGIFDKVSPEEKAARAEQKRMAAEERARTDGEKDAQKATAALEKFGLNLDAYDMDTIRQKNLLNIRSIMGSLFGTGFYRAMTFGSNADKATVGYLGAMIEQNWIIIRQQEQIIRLLEKAR